MQDIPDTPQGMEALIGPKVGEPAPVKVAAAGAWKDPNTFEMLWRYYETPHHDNIPCRFDGDRIRIEFLNGVTQLFQSAYPSVQSPNAERRPVLQGRMAT